MSNVRPTLPYSIQDKEQPPAVQGESDTGSAQEVLNTYMILLKNAAGERQAFEQPSRIDHEQPNGGQHHGQPGAESDDQQQAKLDLLRTKRDQEHQQRAWAGDDPAADAQRQQTAQRHRLPGGRHVRVRLAERPVRVSVEC